MQKIGVFVCWCGSNIAGTVDVARVVEAVRQIPDVAYAIDYKYMCSERGQELIRKAVQIISWTDLLSAAARLVCMRQPSANVLRALASIPTW